MEIEYENIWQKVGKVRRKQEIPTTQRSLLKNKDLL